MEFLILLLIYGAFALASAAKKKQRSSGQPPHPAAPAGKMTAASRTGGRSFGQKTETRLKKEYPHPAQHSAPPSEKTESTYVGSLPPTVPQGTDPCHDDWEHQPSGSLQTGISQGTDPCHDDWASLPVGSLQVDSPEGMDPCHDSFIPDRKEEGPADVGKGTGAGLHFAWSGDEIVKGFVMGEILKRKVG